ncbi:MAG: bifunctional precorrin-2 dehydrogenase/sirohydrochlorin ferrochelatase [Meiothermus sp.]|uniref:precorrin-2 dehydrogenase/sirohydrochlorin ferrochelatase family protein n=2 Tax=Meiothermus sp. TaxID=1955249 RepID=UPI0025CCD815|nr:bifunctional precorrin-2 dehydrogenase/sirohydrochlorin ferrochelatase [Meiothermus sp.]MDW8090299.1 bifunctional precorrin-2 dehydrogenase/sirohydrochlorin ferrochelatase [Meiothermus sp.]MDW8481260.1 bifunctional precorrin-2 dehydrogenase/sirohydrochlorin ferrochelatase [Meiothermus sp.]
MFFPVMLNLQGKPVLFVGGGPETALKVERLVQAGAQVVLVSPFSHPELEKLAEQGSITWYRRGFLPSDLEGVWLCVAHPAGRWINALVAQAAQARRVWLNAVDDPAHCDFILPAVHRQGDLILAVSTSGAAPALGVRIKERLAGEYGPAYATYLELLRSFRPLVQQAYPHDFEARKAAWYRLVDSAALDLVMLGELERAKAALWQALYAQTQSPIPTSFPETHLEAV